METPLSLTTLLGGIIAGLFGVCVSILTLVFTNRGHNQRLQTQHVHDQKIKNRDRDMALRKDIYLAAAEAAYAGLLAVGRFANLDIPYDKLTEGYLDKAPSITKVHIIANEETVRAITNFSTELTAALLRLGMKRFQLIAQKQQVGFLRAQVDVSLKENARMLELQKQYNLDGLADQRRWNALQRYFEFEQARGEQAQQEADALDASLIPQQLKFMEEVYAETIKLGRLLASPLFSIRKELELPIDETVFRRISEEAIAKQAETLKEFMRDLQSQITAQRAVAPPTD